MSFLHLKEFTTDVQGLNSSIKLGTSSLAGLIRHLTQTALKPSRLTVDQALAMCKRRKSLDKYKPAIERLCSVWGKPGTWPYPPFQHGKYIKAVTLNRIVFRGDDRDPKKIFATGFKKRPGRENSKPLYQNTTFPELSKDKDALKLNLEFAIMKNAVRAGDVDSHSTVCITPDMHVASLFPLPDCAERVDDSWLYVCLARKGYDTNGRQVLDALRGVKRAMQFEKDEDLTIRAYFELAKKMNLSMGQLSRHLHNERVYQMFKVVYGRELASDGIPTGDIFGAIKIKRTWNSVSTKKKYVNYKLVGEVISSADFWQGGSYKIVDMVQNPNLDLANMDLSYALAVMRLASGLQIDMKAGKTFPIPKPEDGFVKSSPKPTAEMMQ
ncbi:MAG: hypothetical protein AAGA32_15085 [Pseudomonadota bacterium]